MDERGVTFRTKDGRAITVAGVDFLARFAQHVLPSHFVKIRHYGLHASANATTRLERARDLLPRPAARAPADNDDDRDWRELLLRLTGTDVRVCPRCAERAVVRTALPVARAPPEAA